MLQKGTTSAGPGSASLILDAIRVAGTISRVGISQVTGLTGATVSNVVRRLLEQDLILEIGRAESTGGKPRVLLELNPTARYAIGVHLDHSALTFVVVNLAGAPVFQETQSGIAQASPDEVVERMAHEVDAMILRSGIERERVLGVGLVSPGPLTSQSGIHLAPPFMKHWEEYPLDVRLSEATGLPVLLENDATASAVGEYWSGGTDREANFATLFMGTGLGAGLFMQGSQYSGASGNAGEVGHTCVDINGPQCWCGMRGCVEFMAGPHAVVAKAHSDSVLAHELGLAALPPDSEITSQFAVIATASAAGNTRARALLEESARYIAVAAHSVANILDLQMIVLTGQGFAAASDIYLPRLQETLSNSFFARSSHSVDVRLSRAAETAAAIGGAAIVLQSEFVPQRSASLVANVRKAGAVSELSTLSK